VWREIALWILQSIISRYKLTCGAITGHWIDERFRLKQELLAFNPLEGRHTGQALAQVVMNTLEEYGIKNKFFCVTSDNASNNIKMVEELTKMLDKEGIKWDWKTQHISYLAHVINLVVQKFINTLVPKKSKKGKTDEINDDGDEEEDINDKASDDDEAGNDDKSSNKAADEETNVEAVNTFGGSESFGLILGKVRKIAKSIRGSSLRWERFQHACHSYNIEPATIPLDITVRWNSTFACSFRQST